MPTTTTSPIQLAANRANAALSTGPRTSQGKAASSRNAVSHGICAAYLVIFAWESQQEFDDLRNAYIERHRPIDRCELDQVDRMVDSIWRRNRLLSVETAIMDLQLSRNEDEVAARFRDTGDAFLRMALAFEKKHAERTPDAIQRYITGLDRAFSRARRELEILQGERFNQMPPAPPAAAGPNTSEETRAAAPFPPPSRDNLRVITERSHSESEIAPVLLENDPSDPNEGQATGENT